jgi:hypothetical protein
MASYVVANCPPVRPKPKPTSGRRLSKKPSPIELFDEQFHFCRRRTWQASINAMKMLVRMQRNCRRRSAMKYPGWNWGGTAQSSVVNPSPASEVLLRTHSLAELHLIQEAQTFYCSALIEGLKTRSESWLLENPRVYELGLYLEPFNGGVLRFSQSRNHGAQQFRKDVSTLRKL